MGSLAKGVFAEILWKFCGKFAETKFYCNRKGCGNSAESLQKFRGNLRKIFCNSTPMGLPLPHGFSLRGTKLRPWSKQNSNQNSDHAKLCIYKGKEKLGPWSKFLGRENSDHGLNFGLPRGGGRSCLDENR